MAARTIVISINASWNVVNFRRGLIAALQAEGYRVVVVAPEDEYSPRIQALGVDYLPIDMDKQGVSPRRDLVLLRDYYRLLRRVKPDVFLGYTAKPNIYGSIAARALGIPVINNIAGLGTAFIKQGWLTKILSALYRVALSRSSTVFFQNNEDLSLFLAKKMVRGGQARLLPGSGIDLGRFAPPHAVDRADEGFRFLLVARLLWDKGVREYVEAASIVRRINRGARFQLLGFVDVENRTAVPRRLVEQWHAEGLVEYLGHCDDVRPFIAAADCIVLPSYREGLPRVLLEAAAMGKPLIATDVPGCRQVVEDGKNGFLCEVRSGQSLADAMIKMVRLSSLERSALGTAAREKVTSEFDERLVVASYLQAVREALVTVAPRV